MIYKNSINTRATPLQCTVHDGTVIVEALEPPKIKYLAIDPGEKTGVAAYDSVGALAWLKTVSHEDIVKFIHPYITHKLGRIIIENFKIYPQKANELIYDSLITVRVIGRIEALAEIAYVPMTYQMANLKSIGFKHLGQKEPPRSNPLSHAVVAHAHGTYWLVNHGIVDPATLLDQ